MKFTYTVMEMCDNCYERFWSFQEPVMFCIQCHDLHGYYIEVEE